MTLLVAGAFGPEIAPFSDNLPSDVHLCAVGIGLVAAALGAAEAIATHHARGIVFVGTCGAFEGSRLTIGDVVALGDTVLADEASACGRGHLLPSLAAPLPGDAALTRALVPALAPVRVATVLAVTTNDTTARALSEATGAAVEHLEAYAVASAAARAGIPFAAVLGVANAVGARGRAEWAAHHLRASAAVRAALAPGLEGGAFRALLAGPRGATL